MTILNLLLKIVGWLLAGLGTVSALWVIVSATLKAFWMPTSYTLSGSVDNPVVTASDRGEGLIAYLAAILPLTGILIVIGFGLFLILLSKKSNRDSDV